MCGIVLYDAMISVSHGTTSIKITLWCIHVRHTELADSLTAVRSLPKSVANAHIERGAFSVSIAGIGTF